MSERENLSVAVPWSLSHYIPLNGFNPLYRALFDQSPANIELHAWDNVKLHNRFARDIEIRDVLLKEANEEKLKSRESGKGPITREYYDYFWPPNQALTNALIGDMEFHHTAPFPSLGRPFVFHCESFAPVFLPFSQQGSGEFENHEEIREHYHRIFTNPLCLGIFSHIPETLDSLRLFFCDPDIDRKLFTSRIGLSDKAFVNPELPEKTALSAPKFLFVHSAHQNPANFFRRGGHLVLRFWKEFKETGRDGLLILRSAMPSESELLKHGVDVSFLSTEMGHSILWAKDYLASHEMNALMASAHFLLLPSASLHSASIMQAMTLGTIPVVTDTVGTSVYVTDNEHGIVLHGVRSVIWHTDQRTGVLLDHYNLWPSLDDGLVSQMTGRILTLLDASDAYQKMRRGTMHHAREQFSGQAFSADFWNAVSDLYQNYERSSLGSEPVPNRMACSLSDCTLEGDGWARAFESPTQPVRRMYTGQSVVNELGGAFIHAYGNPSMELSDWSVMARYYSPGAPKTTFANTVDELEGKYLSFAAGLKDEGEPCLLEEGYRGFNLIAYAGQVFVAEMAAGRVDLTDPETVEHWLADGRLHRAATIDGGRAIANQRAVEAALASLASRVSLIAPEPGGEPRLLEQGYRGFNLLAHAGQVWAVAMAAGPVDFADAGALEPLVVQRQLLRAATMDGARAAVDRLLDRRAFEAELSSLGSRLEERLAEMETRINQPQQSVMQQIEERFVASERPWWRRLAGMGHKKNRGMK